MTKTNYPVGTTGKKWGSEEKTQWYALQSIKRSYQDEVLVKINALSSRFNVSEYGALNYADKQYSLCALTSKNIDPMKPTVLITGGVHGYETSGVHGALLFAEDFAEQYQSSFNFLIVPCVSPWGYETINRWNPNAIDPNRSFYSNSPAQESALLMALVSQAPSGIIAHIDLHETTDTDNSEFRPALAARDAAEHNNWNIPDGFYLVGDTVKPMADFQSAIIDAVKEVTHIAPADANNKLIGVDIEQFGVINYAAKELGLCMGMTDAPFVTTTEVYPDSPNANDETCNLAQAIAVRAGLDFILAHNEKRT